MLPFVHHGLNDDCGGCTFFCGVSANGRKGIHEGTETPPNRQR
jgi:hypothetical protein